MFIDEHCAGDENLKLAASRYWFKLNKNKLFKIASQKYRITPEHTLNGHADAITSAAISGNKIVTGSWDNNAIIWDLNNGTRLHTLNGHTDWINSVAISGDKVVTGTNDKSAIIWDLNTGARLHTLNGHTNFISSVAISGDKVVTGSWDNNAIIWDLNTGKKLHTLNGHTGVVTSVAISDDKVVTGSWDNNAIIWDITQPIKKLFSNETDVITFNSLIKIDKKLHEINDEDGAGPATN